MKLIIVQGEDVETTRHMGRAAAMTYVLTRVCWRDVTSIQFVPQEGDDEWSEGDGHASEVEVESHSGASS